jgi:hypothetical protein
MFLFAALIVLPFECCVLRTAAALVEDKLGAPG